MVFGTFDCLHPGHEFFMKQALKHGDQLYVVIARNNTVHKVKGHTPSFNERARLKTVSKLEFVHKAILGHKANKYDIIKKITPDVICLGYDQFTFTELLQSKIIEMNLNCQIVRMDPYRQNEFKSSIIKQKYTTKTLPKHLTIQN